MAQTMHIVANALNHFQLVQRILLKLDYELKTFTFQHLFQKRENLMKTMALEPLLNIFSLATVEQSSPYLVVYYHATSSSDFTNFGSFFSDFFMLTPQNLEVKVRIHRLVGWDELTMDNPLKIKKDDQCKGTK